MIDNNGYRSNVGIMLANSVGKLLWARRVQSTDSWQFPQGGIQVGETPEDALYRELYEEIGLDAANVELISSINGWLSYRLPKYLVREHQSPLCIGQKQKWYLLRLLCDDRNIRLDATTHMEFDQWRWVTYWYPLSKIVAFKREVYRRALKELSAAHSQIEATSSYGNH
jgi:putative (di)nucleoside polyphosphate hydrolase